MLVVNVQRGVYPDEGRAVVIEYNLFH